MPSGRRNLLSQRVLALIGEDWLDVDDLMEQALPLVPPGKAQRVYANMEEKNRKDREQRILEGKKTIATQPRPEAAERERIGGRVIVNDILAALRNSKTIEMEVGLTRLERKIRLSDERRYSHHCCLHGGSCRGDAHDEEPDSDPPVLVVEVRQDLDTLPIPNNDPLFDLIERVLASRKQRMELPKRVDLREVVPGEIDRLLARHG